MVVFSSDLKQVGDVRNLEGREIEIDGEIKSYDGRAEIILHRASQLRGDAAHIPPLPKQYDVERKRQVQRRHLPLSQTVKKRRTQEGIAACIVRRSQLARIFKRLKTELRVFSWVSGRRNDSIHVRSIRYTG